MDRSIGIETHARVCVHLDSRGLVPFPSIFSPRLTITPALIPVCRSTPWPQVFAETVPWFEGAMADPRFTRERDDVLTWVYRHVSKFGKQKALQRALGSVYRLKESVVDRLIANETAAGIAMPEPPPEVLIVPENAVSKMEL